MKIYIYNTKLIDDSNMEQYSSLVCRQRREKIIRQKQKNDQKRSLAAGLALKTALCKEGLDYDNTIFDTGANGKPYIEQTGSSKIYYNLSHSGEYAVAVVAEEEVGVDIEKIGRCNLKVAQKCFTPQEYHFIAQKKAEEQEEAFAVIWTLKESYLKAIGEGIRKKLNSFETQYCEKQRSAFVEGNRNAYIKVLKEVKGYIISVCAFHEINNIEINFIEREYNGR